MRIQHRTDLAILQICALTLGVVALALAAAPPASDKPSAEGLRLVREVRGIRIFHRSVPGFAIPEVQAHAIIEASPSCVYAVISDYDHFAEFVPYVKRSRILKQEPGLRWVSQQLSFPGPISDREFVIRIVNRVNFPSKDFFRVEWRLDVEETRILAEQSGTVPTRFSGFWELRPNREGTGTDATYAVHIDPGGALPTWLVTFGTNRFLPAVVEAIRRRALSSGSRPPRSTPVTSWSRPRDGN